MTTTHETKDRSSKDLIDALSSARASARVQMHLLSLDAREGWRELESKLDNLQSKIEREGERVGENATKKARELTRSVRDFLRDNGGAAESGTLAGQLMKPVRSCRPGDMLNEAARLMWELDCGAVPVVNEAEHLVGIITDRDICMAAYTRGQPLAALSVENAMSRHVSAVSPKDSLESITVLMRQKQIRRIPVVDNGRLVGIVTLADIAQHIEQKADFGPGAAMNLAHTLAIISEHRAASASTSIAAE
jgi:CBS domain-containing protein